MILKNAFSQRSMRLLQVVDSKHLQPSKLNKVKLTVAGTVCSGEGTYPLAHALYALQEVADQ